MHIFLQIIFLIILIAAAGAFVRKMMKIRRNIFLGTPKEITGDKSERIKNVILLAFGQQKMFNKPLVGILHFLVYFSFIVINIELIEIVIDGIFGTHRFFMPYFGPLYFWMINFFEILAVITVIACSIFLIRRNIIKIPRLSSAELKGWPHLDANLILIFEIVLMGLFLKMNAADSYLSIQEGGDMKFLISQHLIPFFNNFSIAAVEILEQVYWWLHIVGILFFLNYVPYSKHLHIILAFPNSYYASLEPEAEMSNMKNIENEVHYAMDPASAPTDATPEETPGMFGAKDIFDLPWKNLLDSYACTECGRCTEQCPANITGKKLSPREIMMATRDRVEDVGKNIDRNGKFEDDGKTLLFDYITTEELRACTSCMACVETCPVSISPLSIIFALRRNLIMEESDSPQEWNLMFSNIETNFAPWKFSPDQRDAWVKSMNDDNSTMTNLDNS